MLLVYGRIEAKETEIVMCLGRFAVGLVDVLFLVGLFLEKVLMGGLFVVAVFLMVLLRVLLEKLLVLFEVMVLEGWVVLFWVVVWGELEVVIWVLVLVLLVGLVVECCLLVVVGFRVVRRLFLRYGDWLRR